MNIQNEEYFLKNDFVSRRVKVLNNHDYTKEKLRDEQFQHS